MARRSVRYSIARDRRSLRAGGDLPIFNPKYTVMHIFKLAALSFLVLGCNALPAQQTEGMASYYADRFHSLPTSTGETYDKHALTAASKEFPYGTVLEVTEIVSGKKVRVRVNDCGPHHPERIIDLSRAAAAKVGLLRKGTARVRLRVIKTGDLGPTCERAAWARANKEQEELTLVPLPYTPPPTSTAPAPAPSPTVMTQNKAKVFPADAMLFGVQIGAYGRVDNAAAMVERLRSLGFEEVFMAKVGRVHRVFAGRFYFQDEARQLRERVREAGFRDASVRRVQ